jgi:YgiT-type zinc finger domain-containing protein
LTFADIETAIANGRVRRRFTRDPRGLRYEVVELPETAAKWPSSAGSRRLEGFSSSRPMLWSDTMKAKTKGYDYGKCHVCGAAVKEEHTKLDFWVRGKLIVIERVPAGVCSQCGERVVRAEVGRTITCLLADSRRLAKQRTLTVPVIRFAQAVA